MFIADRFYYHPKPQCICLLYLKYKIIKIKDLIKRTLQFYFFNLLDAKEGFQQLKETQT